MNVLKGDVCSVTVYVTTAVNKDSQGAKLKKVLREIIHIS